MGRKGGDSNNRGRRGMIKRRRSQRRSSRSPVSTWKMWSSRLWANRKMRMRIKREAISISIRGSRKREKVSRVSIKR